MHSPTISPTPVLTLVSHTLCPYVQRAAIALEMKQVPFQRRTIDLAQKPDWFLKLSPLGKVPLLKIDGDTILFESNVILEYLEETEAGPLHPADPLQRAYHRSWMEFGSAILNAIGRFYSARDADAFRGEAVHLAGLFARLETALGNGPWFSGKDFSLVDAVYGPVFRYFDTFDRFGDFEILAEKPKIASWRANLAAHPAVIAAVRPDYDSELTAFLLRRESFLAKLGEKQDANTA